MAAIEKLKQKMQNDIRKVRFKDFQRILIHAGFIITEGRGTRCKFSKGNIKIVLHIPHGNNHDYVDPNAVKEALEYTK